jgi:hypothetical protein
LKALFALAALAAGCGRGDDCKDARDAAGKAVAAVWPGLDEQRDNAEQALAAAIRHRDDLKHWRLEWGEGLRNLQRDMGCFEAKEVLRCCDRMSAWLRAHRKPDVTTSVSRYFPSMFLTAQKLKKVPGREEEAEKVVAAIESVHRLMATDTGGPEVPGQVADACNAARQVLEQLVSVADVVPGQPVEIHAALDERAAAARLAHDWLVALASGASASVPHKLPPALRSPAAAVARYQSACHD